MEVIVGKYAGMCGGVKHTIDMANKILDENKGKEIYCLGELVHNKTVVQELEEKGLHVVDDINQIPNNAIAIFRAHGVKKECYHIAVQKKLQINDLTCVNVEKVHEKVINHKSDFIILLGKKDHAEAVATISFATQDSMIIEDEKDIQNVLEKVKKSNLKKVFIVAQTTYSSEKFDEISSEIKAQLERTGIQVEVDKTICMATEIRQNEANELSKNADAVVVIGGKNSSNTKKLYNIALNNCKNVYYIENPTELDLEKIKESNFDSILILAGASTPSEDISNVKEKLCSI